MHANFMPKSSSYIASRAFSTESSSQQSDTNTNYIVIHRILSCLLCLLSPSSSVSHLAASVCVCVCGLC